MGQLWGVDYEDFRENCPLTAPNYIFGTVGASYLRLQDFLFGAKTRPSLHVLHLVADSHVLQSLILPLQLLPEINPFTH